MIHIASHSFTPQLNGQVRRADAAFLYDPPQCYVGIELEVNQKFFQQCGTPWRALSADLIASLRQALLEDVP